MKTSCRSFLMGILPFALCLLLPFTTWGRDLSATSTTAYDTPECAVAPVCSASAACSSACKDSSLVEKLDIILLSLEQESIAVKCEMADFFIDSCEDSLTRQDVALHLYSYYRKSAVMGVEAVSIHIFDEWFATSKASFPTQEEFLLAKLYAETNRATLLGCKAPAVELFDSTGAKCTLPGKRTSIVFFYDTDCVKCGYYTIALASNLANADPAADFYAVYVGRDSLKWADYRRKAFPELENCTRLRMHHLWDPCDSSSFPLKYGVTSTPKLFLLDSDARVLGRCLDPYTLETLLGLPQLCLCPVGESLPALKLSGQMYSCPRGKIRERKASKRLDRLSSTLVFFHTSDCENCKREREGIASYLMAHPEHQLFLVEASLELVKYFDLSILPFEVYVGKDGKVEKKYVSILE